MYRIRYVGILQRVGKCMIFTLTLECERRRKWAVFGENSILICLFITDKFDNQSNNWINNKVAWIFGWKFRSWWDVRSKWRKYRSLMTFLEFHFVKSPKKKTIDKMKSLEFVFSRINSANRISFSSSFDQKSCHHSVLSFMHSYEWQLYMWTLNIHNIDVQTQAPFHMTANRITFVWAIVCVQCVRVFRCVQHRIVYVSFIRIFLFLSLNFPRLSCVLPHIRTCDIVSFVHSPFRITSSFYFMRWNFRALSLSLCHSHSVNSNYFTWIFRLFGISLEFYRVLVTCYTTKIPTSTNDIRRASDPFIDFCLF